MLLAIGEKMRGGVIAMSFVVIIAVLMIVPLLYDYVRGGGSNDAIKVDDITISANEFSNRKSQAQQELLQAFQGNIPDYINQGDFLDKQVTEQLIQEALLKKVIQDGYDIGESQLRQSIQSLPAFQKDGEYDKQTADDQLQSMGMSRPTFKRRFKEQLLNTQFQTGITNTAFVPKGVLETIAKLQFQERSFDYVNIDSETIRARQTVSSEELNTFFDENTAQFQHPEKVSLNYVRFGLGAFKETIQITDAQAKSEYDTGIAAGRYSTPESRDVSHILIEDGADAQTQAQKVLDDINAGKIEFKAAAKQFSKDPGSASQGGSLGTLLRDGQMVPEFETAAFTQAKGELPGLVKSDYGYHIIRVDNINPKKVEPFDKVKANIIESLKGAQAQKVFDEYKNEAANIAYEQPDDLTAVLNYLNTLGGLNTQPFKLENTELFTQSEGKGIAQTPAIRQAAFSETVLAQKNNSELLQDNEGNLVFIRVKDHEASRPMTFDEAKSNIEQAVLANKTQKEINRISTGILDGLKSGKTLAELAKANKLKVDSAKGMTRLGDDTVKREVVKAAFELPVLKNKQPEFTSTRYGVSSQAVIVLNSIKDGDWSTLGEEKQKQLITTMEQAQGSGDMQATMAQLRKEADIWVNPNLSNSQTP